MEKGFVKAFNKMIINPKKRKEWEWAVEAGTPLKKIRGKQMIDLSKQGVLSKFIPELARLVLIKAAVYGAKTYDFTFMDGSTVKVTV